MQQIDAIQGNGQTYESRTGQNRLQKQPHTSKSTAICRS